MYDKITNVIISDEVQAGDYPVTIDKAAEHATMIAPVPPATAIPATGKIEESMEGTISINGSKVEIKAGMTADEVYEAIRDAGEMGWVNVFATDGTQTLPLNVDNLDTQGYNKMPGGYQFGVQLGFVSQNYGSDESVTITCDNDQLAALLGIDGLPNATRTETIEYNWQTFGIEEIRIMRQIHRSLRKERRQDILGQKQNLQKKEKGRFTLMALQLQSKKE